MLLDEEIPQAELLLAPAHHPAHTRPRLLHLKQGAPGPPMEGENITLQLLPIAALIVHVVEFDTALQHRLLRVERVARVSNARPGAPEVEPIRRRSLVAHVPDRVADGLVEPANHVVQPRHVPVIVPDAAALRDVLDAEGGLAAGLVAVVRGGKAHGVVPDLIPRDAVAGCDHEVAPHDRSGAAFRLSVVADGGDSADRAPGVDQNGS